MNKENNSTGKQKNILNFNNQEERDQLSDELISLSFLGKVDQIMIQRGISKKILAERLGTSASYITQLFQGDKLVNIRLLTKLRRALDVSIEITCLPLTTHDETHAINQLQTGKPVLLGLPPDSAASIPDTSLNHRNKILIFLEDKNTGSFSFTPNSEIRIDYGNS